ncbi:5'-3' exoribonuclease 3 isoform X1 [Coffea arabica]|uniref:5'-3' exoribonuclease n=1 Tax=Coffea arabica TaxID=13443 RepID=A0A6P6TYW1_COFAR|nr:5'-3' exoribonuclease 3-like isoform X1 [Coffea arabica]
MGVPSFFRWLVQRYPKIVSDANSDENHHGLEFDNLYLDMNGIIHPCFHPEDMLFPPTTFEDVFSNIYDYIDQLFNIVKPRKLLYMAIDGVAPRAKMNQQRARRFRTAKDNEAAEEVETKLRKNFEREGKKVLPREESELSDSNIITPGTEFMDLLSKKLQNYIKRRMTTDSRWSKIKVILSDANVPSEGEHKIMSFIRAQRSSEGYDPNTQHCLYGLDADLIMLALATHEVHFSILREDVLVHEEILNGVSELERSARKAESYSGKCRGWFKQVVDKSESVPKPASCHIEVVSASEKSDRCSEASKKLNRRLPVMKKPFQYLHIWLLREYLHIDLNISDPPENLNIDLERIIDDFIFICFFTGNDFLPHMPTLEIHEGAIDLLMYVYKKEMKNLGGYLVDTHLIEDKKGRYIKLKRVEKFILSVGEYEEKIFKKRLEIKERKLRRIQSELLNAQDTEDDGCIEANLWSSLGNTDNAFQDRKMSEIVDSTSGLDEKDISLTDYSEVLNNTKELMQELKDRIQHQSDTFRNGGLFSDKVKLGVQGWKKRYYEVKFSAKTDEVEQRRRSLVAKYTEGLCWVLKYYFSGVPSWTWFYPFHYGPFASDLKGLTQVNVKFQKGLPLKPFDQLLAVLPPKSCHALPEAYKRLMVDADSSILEFYPARFETDADGKRFMWQAICKLPFIQEDRLLVETKKAETELKDHEKERNAETADQLFIGSSSGLGEQISSVYKNCTSFMQNDYIKINDMLNDGLSGFMHLCEADQDVFCAFYKLPSDYVPKRLLAEGVNIPEESISEADIVKRELWHEYNGSAPNRALVNRNHVQKSSLKNKEPAVISKFAGTGWSVGRGKLNNSTTQRGPVPALKSYAHCVGNSSFPSSSTSTSASGLNWRPEKLSNTSASDNSWSRWQNTDKDSWQSSSTSNASPAWRQSQPFSCASPGQQVHGRGQYFKSSNSCASPQQQVHGRGQYFHKSSNSSASPRQQVHGRGQYVDKSSHSAWNTGSRYGRNNGERW